MVIAAIAMIAAIPAGGCSDPPARVRLVALGGLCARPLGGNLVRVTAYTRTGERTRSLGLDETLAIDEFPDDTEQIGVEVAVAGGGTGAAGKSAPLDYGALADGTAIPVFMAAPDGFCEIGPMREARGAPLVARAGAGALIVGGAGPAGPLSTAEYYDPIEGAFVEVAVPEAVVDTVNGFTGAVLATLPDGRVAVSGGPSSALFVFDPTTRAFSSPALIVSRAFHGAIATGDAEVLLAGGCASVTEPMCQSLRQTARYQLSDIGHPVLLPVLPTGARIAAQLFDVGIQLDGRHRYLLAGGTGDLGRADRFTLDEIDVAAVRGGRVQPAALDGGAVLTAFADDAPATAASGAAAVFAPDAGAAQPIAKAPDLKGVRLIALEDGRVAGFGGDPMGRVLSYDPMRDAWTAALGPGDRTGALTAPSLVRLLDGSVLVIDGAVSSRAWLYRPSLVGPAAGSITVIPNSSAGRGVLTPPDPATVTRATGPAAWVLTSPGDALTARALVGGPRTATGSVRATVHVRSGGVALIAEQTGPGQAIVGEFAPGAPPRVVRLAGGAAQPLCSAPPALSPFDPMVATTLRLAITGASARLFVEEQEVLACNIGATERGAWGIAALGAGAQLEVDLITVAR